MKMIGLHNTALTSAVALFCWAACGNSYASQPPAARLSPAEQKEYELIQKALRNHEDLLTAATWTLAHCADEKEVKRIEKTVTLLQAFGDTNQIPKLVEAGGVKRFKQGAAKLLKSKDPVVRGFAAVLLAATGDTEHKRDIARLLEDKGEAPPKEEDSLLYNFDRSRAAMALGLMRAREYEPRLAALLHSSAEADRSGAALGLGYMGAKEHVNALAKLLSDDEDRVRAAAVQALAQLDAADYAGDIAKLLTGDPDLNETACYALVRLNAREQGKDLAALLDDRFRKGNAAKALALLGAKEYTEAIARLADDSGPLVRCDALLALGILGADEHVETIAAHLRDKEPFVRSYAGVALLLMRNQQHSQEVENMVLAEMKLPDENSAAEDTAAYFRGLIRLHPLIAERQQHLVTRALEEWQRINRSKETLAPDNAAKGSQSVGSESNRTPSTSAAGERSAD